MVSSVVLFKPRIHLLACTHPSVSNTLGRRTSASLQPFVQTRLDWILVCAHSSVSIPVFQTRLDYGSVSVYKHLPTAPLIKHVWIVVPCLRTRISLHPVFQTRLDCGSLSAYTHQSPARCSNTFDYGCLFVYKHLCLEPKRLRLTWIILVFRVVEMVMGTSTVA